MKRKGLLGVLMLAMAAMIISPMNLNAQEDEGGASFSVGGDLVSSYLWRGTKFGTGPAIQPGIAFTVGGLEIGGWGSYCFTANEGAEADLYISYGFDFGLSVGFTDYYFPGSPYFQYGESAPDAGDGSHAFEANLGYGIGGLSVSANMFLNATPNGAGTAGSDLYFELGYDFEKFGVFVGAGNGWHTVEADPDESDFNVCNIGIQSSYDIKVTESFSLPITGAVILNPDTEQFHVVVGVSF